ncbi:MAG TPA: histidine phosphatase family protein [Blastocatellia bacterium]|jgi:broad specificity phosphatase PhoE|nr:histidine phosphatase family protein [Blastocatellia bacterium]
MGYLVLIRHGQSRSFEKDSDRLSPLGEEQARALAKYWILRGVNFDEVYAGALIRQQRTAEIVEECFVQSGVDWPRLQTTPELNEYDSIGIINNLIPSLAERDAAFRALAEEFDRNRTAPERNRHFQRMFEAVTSVWLGGELEVEGVESWRLFQSRVRAAIKRITSAEGSGRRVAVFTSGGVIGLTVQNVLNAPEAKALEINWRVRNCSLTEFIFSRDRMSLDSFNAIPHLDDPALRTYR